MPDDVVRPRFHQTVLDAEDARALAEFYRALLGWSYRSGDEDGPADWLVLVDPGTGTRLAFQQVDEVPRVTWPDGPVPQQLHLDLVVETEDELAVVHPRVLELGATLLVDRFDDDEEPLYVYADPQGHPFCVFATTPRAD